MRVRVKLGGLSLTLRRLRRMKDGKAQKAILKKGIRAATAVVLKAARKKVPVDTGWLKKALAVKVSVNKKTGAVYGLVGPRTKYRRNKKTGSRELNTWAAKLAAKSGDNGAWPSKYAHLVHGGRKALEIKLRNGATWRVKAVPAKPFLADAVAECRAAAMNAMKAKIAAELAKL